MFDIAIVFDIGVIALRIIMPVFAILIVYQCFAAMRRRRRPEKPLVTLCNLETGEKLPVVFWENSIGRGKRNDIVIDHPTVSKDHCVLLRRKEGWLVSDTGSTGGTYVNGERTLGRTRVLIDDVITFGRTQYRFKRGDEYQEELKADRFFKKPSSKPAMTAWKLMLMVTVFHFFMCVEAMFWNDNTNVFSPLILFGALMFVEWGFFFVSYFILRRVTFELEALALFLTGIGVMLLVRQVERSAYVQLIAAAAGMVLYCVIIKFIENPDMTKNMVAWLVIRFSLMGLALMLLATSILFGKIVGGAANWIYIGGISIQPSELVKVIYILVGAASLDKLHGKIGYIYMFIFIGFSAACVGLLALMSDFGTALIFFITFLLIAFMQWGDFKIVIAAVASAGFGGFIVLRFMPYVMNRFKAWRHVWEYAQNEGYQQAHVLTFIASGGLFGVGVGNGFLKQVAASESDLVFGLVAEEMGVIVAITLALAVGLMFVYTRAITTRSRSTFYSISACCAAGLMLIQLSLNIFGATDILPLTGVTFPFISCGGSSILSVWGLLAFIKAADERTYSMKR